MRRRDSFDYYDAKSEEIYDNDNMYYYDDVRDPRERFNGTMEFTALKGHGGLDINSRPWGDETMMFDRPQFGMPFPGQQINNNGFYNFNGNQRQYPYGQYPYYNTQQLNMNQNPYAQNPYNTQSFSFNNMPNPNMSSMQPNPFDLNNSRGQQFGNTQQFDKPFKKEEKKTLVEPHVIEKTIEIVKEPDGPNPYNTEETKDLLKVNSEEARSLIKAKNDETKNLIKEGFNKQKEINRASFEKQMENAQKAADLQKQVNDLTQSFEKAIKTSNEVNSEETKSLLKEGFEKQNEINKASHARQEETAKKTADLQKQVDNLSKTFEIAIKTSNEVNSEETKSLLKESFEKQNEINKAAFAKQEENAKKAADLQKQINDLTQTFEIAIKTSNEVNSEEAKKFIKDNSETKSLLKEGFEKQSEINKASFEKQMVNEQKTADLQRQVNDLTQTFETAIKLNKNFNIEETKKILKDNSETKSLLKESFEKQNEINKAAFAKQVENEQKTAALQKQVNDLTQTFETAIKLGSDVNSEETKKLLKDNSETKSLLKEGFEKQNEINKAAFAKQIENEQKTAALQKQVSDLTQNIERIKNNNVVVSSNNNDNEATKAFLKEGFSKQNEINKAAFAKQMANEQKTAELQKQVSELTQNIEKIKNNNVASSNNNDNEATKTFLKEGFSKQNEINKAAFAKQMANEQKTAELQKQVSELTQNFERIKQNGGVQNGNNEETKSLLKQGFTKQNEINRASFAKQMANEQKTAELEKQVKELTQTIANVTNNFGKAMSNISNNLKSTQDMLRNQTQEFEVKGDLANSNDVIIKSTTTVKKNNEAPLNTNKKINEEITSHTRTQNVYVGHEPIQAISGDEEDLILNSKMDDHYNTRENNLKYLDEEQYSTSEFDADSINPVKLKDRRNSKKANKRAAKEAKASLRQQKKEVNKKKR